MSCIDLLWHDQSKRSKNKLVLGRETLRVKKYSLISESQMIIFWKDCLWLLSFDYIGSFCDSVFLLFPYPLVSSEEKHTRFIWNPCAFSFFMIFGKEIISFNIISPDEGLPLWEGIMLSIREEYILCKWNEICGFHARIHFDFSLLSPCVVFLF